MSLVCHGNSVQGLKQTPLILQWILFKREFSFKSFYISEMNPWKR